MSGKINASPSFRLTGHAPLLPQTLPKDKHHEEFLALTEQIKVLDEQTKDLVKKLEKLHNRRTKFARQISNFINKHQEEKKQTSENRLMQIQSERLGRLNLCSRLMDSRCRLSSLIKNQPLPDLQRPQTTMGERPENVQTGSDTLLNFLRMSSPEVISNFFAENAIPRLLVYCPKKKFNLCGNIIDISEFVNSLPSILTQIPYQNRFFIFQKILDTYHESSYFTQLFEYTALHTDPSDIIHGIEHGALNLLRCRKVKLLIASELSTELTYIHGGIRRTVPLTTGLIPNTVRSGKYRIVNDPFNSNDIDLAVESMLFEGVKNAIIVPLYHQDFTNPFVIIAMDKVRDDTFTPSDYVLISYFFKSISMQIKNLVRELSSITETDMTNLVYGLSVIASSHNTHDMIKAICDVSEKLLDSSATRIFTVVNDCLCEETPGIKISGKMLPVDNGLVCNCAIKNETFNYFLPRREKQFSVSIDDITQPRIWSMLAAPITYHGEVKGAYVLYNRKNVTFFSARETFIATNLARCISSIIHICCESTNLVESLERNNDNILHAYNLTVYSLKSIQTAGTAKLFSSMQLFCNKMKPSITFRFYIYENDKLLDAETNQPVSSEPQLLDAICDLKPTAATAESVGILVIPIKTPSGQINLFEFRAPLMQLKTEEEKNGILQRTRILQSLDGPSSKLSAPEQIQLGKTGSRRNSQYGKSSSNFHSSSSGFFDLQNQQGNTKMPFAQLSLKSMHGEDSGLSSTSVFELSKDQSTYDKFLIVSSSWAGKTINGSASFEEQLDEDKLQIYPFDSSITNILQSFSMMTTRQLSLHQKIVSLKSYDVILRGLHVIGNVLACPMPFSDLLDILMKSFTCLFGQTLSLVIYDPPLFDSNDNDLDPKFLNLERDRMIFASIKIPEAMMLDRSTALSCFADLLLALMASRADNQKVEPLVSPNFPPLVSSLDINFLENNIKDTIGLAVEILCAFHVHEFLKCTREKINRWLGTFAVNPEDSTVFLLAVDALQFTYAVYKQFDLFKHFTDSELAAGCIAAFMRVGFPHMRPDFKYAHALRYLPLNKVNPKILIRVTTALICLSYPGCDLLEETPEERITGLTELLLERQNNSMSVLLAKYKLYAKRGLNFKNRNHRVLVGQFVTELCQSSIFFRPLAAFEKTCLMSKEPQSMILFRITKVVKPMAEALELTRIGLNSFTEALSDKEPWVIEKGEGFFSLEFREEEEHGNISLSDAR